MKLATLADGSRDGRLVVVSRDLTRVLSAAAVAPTLQVALERWDSVEAELKALSQRLESGGAEGVEAFDQSLALSPLPRAYQWLDASAFLSHGRLMDVAFNRSPSPDGVGRPLMYQGASDDFLAPTQDASFPSEADGIDCEAEFAVVLGETPMGAEGPVAEAAIRLVLLVNDWSLRGFGPREMRSGFGFLQAKPATAFAPVAVTPDELGEAWADGRLDLPVDVTVRGERLGRPSGVGMSFTVAELIAHAARTRRLRAGTILGFGTVSNDDAETVGSACLAERRALDVIAGREPTSYLHFGDTVRIEVFGADGSSMFGAIDQRVVRANPPVEGAAS